MAVKIVIILNVLHIYVLEFEKLVRNKSDINNFTLTKTHNLAYEEHIYYKTNIIKKISYTNSKTESQWNDKNFRIQFF